MKRSENQSPLPYLDTKPEGAADFYFAINATFRFVIERFGETGWHGYLSDLARGYFEPVNRRWREGGLPEVASYWQAFFDAEPGAVVDVEQVEDSVTLEVRECPAIKHLKAAGREIVPVFCQHCYYLGNARAEASGLQMRLTGGNGSCCHQYSRQDLPPQDIADIREVR